MYNNHREYVQTLIELLDLKKNNKSNSYLERELQNTITDLNRTPSLLECINIELLPLDYISEGAFSKFNPNDVKDIRTYLKSA